MARSLRLEYEGAVYHVTLQGNEQEAVRAFHFAVDRREVDIVALDRHVGGIDIFPYY